jgi:hypothetical protein
VIVSHPGAIDRLYSSGSPFWACGLSAALVEDVSQLGEPSTRGLCRIEASARRPDVPDVDEFDEDGSRIS